MDYTAEGALYALAKIRWSLFGTLTYRQSPRPQSAMGLVWHHMGHASLLSGVPYSRLLMVIREEHGGLGGRLHHHYLLGGVGVETNLYSMAARLKWDWRSHGFAEIREFDNAQQGVAYVCKTLGVRDAYELDRFGRVSKTWDRVSLTLSSSVGRVLRSMEHIRTDGACCTTAKTGGRRALPRTVIQNPVALASSLHGGQGITLGNTGESEVDRPENCGASW